MSLACRVYCQPTVVRETFCQLNDGDEICGCGQVLADPSKSVLLVLVWFSSFGCGLRFDIVVLDNGILLINV